MIKDAVATGGTSQDSTLAQRSGKGKSDSTGKSHNHKLASIGSFQKLFLETTDAELDQWTASQQRPA